MNPSKVPEISVQDLDRKIKAGERFVIIDVREPWETDLVSIKDERVVLVPLSRISEQAEEAFPQEVRDLQTEVVVMCHRGVRSAQATGWMKQKGWQNVVSLRGGIAEYAEEIDPSVGTY